MSDVDPRKTLALGLIGGFLGIYAVPINPVLGPLFAAVGAVCAVVWGADAIARVASYGLGTGVPSIGYMSLAMAVVAFIAGLAGGFIPGVPIVIGPLLVFILAMILGGVTAFLLKRVIHMKIPILVRGTAELTGAASLAVLGYSAAIAGSYALPKILAAVIATGYIVLFFILVTMAIQHPFNACLGPNENRLRTLKLASCTGFITMAVVGVLGIAISPAWWVIAIIGALAWLISIRMFIQASVDEAASVAWTGWWPRKEGGEL